MGEGLHLCLPYRDLQAQVAALAAFLREGLAGGEICLVGFRGDRSRFEAALSLDAPGLRLFPAERLERCRQPEALLRRLLRAFPARRLRIAFDFGSPDPGPLAWERALRRMAGDAVLLCQFDVSQMSDEALADRISRHPWLLLGGRLCPSPPADFPSRTRQLLDWLLDGVDSSRKLELRERELASLLAHTPDEIARVDSSHRALYLNAALADTLGKSPEALVGSSLADLSLPPVVQSRWDEALERVFDSAEEVEFEYKVLSRAGPVWKHARIVPERGPSGVATALCVTRDVTNRKQLEVTLRQRVRQLRELLDLSLLLQGVTTEREASEVVVDLLPLLCHRAGALQARLGEGGDGFPLPDGRVLEIEGLEELLPDERTVVDVALERLGETFRRIAAERERRRGEERLQALVESASDLVFILAPDAAIRYAGPSVTRILGYDPEALVGTDGLLLVHPEDRATVREGLLQCLGSGRSWFEARIQTHDGAWRTFEMQAADRVDHPAVGGIVVNSRDITDRRLLERQLLRSQKMEAIGRLAGGVAHDFNNLLTVIAGGAEFLLQREPGLAPDLEEILAATRRAANLTRQLLAFSRRQVVNLRVLEVDATVEEMERLFRRLIGEDVELVTRLGARGVCVRADHAQLEQVVLNLVVNARDAMPQGGRLTVSTAVVDGAWLRLRVEDTGVGIPPEAQPRIFEPFFTTRAGGTGLGLATVYGIVQGSGGHIRFESRPGEGTLFEVDLPVVSQAVPEAPPAEAPAPPLPGNETILVVEDEVVLRRMTRRILEGSGYRVLEADGGPAALEIADGYDGRIDLLLSDVVMPKLNGWDLAMEMLRRRPGVRLVFTSGYTSDTVLDAGMLQRGEIVFLEKPYGPKELLRTVRNVLDPCSPGVTRISAEGAA